MKYRTFADFWDTQKGTRKGQCFGLLVIGLALALLASLKTKGLGLGERVTYGTLGGLALGILLILAMVVPSIYLAFIRRKKAEGKSVTVHRILFGLYFFPFLTYSVFGAIALALNLFA